MAPPSEPASDPESASHHEAQPAIGGAVMAPPSKPPSDPESAEEREVFLVPEDITKLPRLTQAQKDRLQREHDAQQPPRRREAFVPASHHEAQPAIGGAVMAPPSEPPNDPESASPENRIKFPPEAHWEFLVMGKLQEMDADMKADAEREYQENTGCLLYLDDAVHKSIPVLRARWHRVRRVLDGYMARWWLLVIYATQRERLATASATSVTRALLSSTQEALLSSTQEGIYARSCVLAVIAELASAAGDGHASAAGDGH